MIDPAAPAASVFLWLTAFLFLFVFALPILFAPFAWARVFRWTVTAEDHLTLYFARCLGAVALAITGCAMRAAPHAAREPLFFELIGSAGALLAAVHIWGALKKQQPWTETLEIVLYVGASAAAWLLHP